MSKNAPITKLSGLDINPTDASETKFTGLYIPQLTAGAIEALDASVVRNGGFVYDITNNRINARVNNAWVTVTTT
jgi:hypothetical protein